MADAASDTGERGMRDADPLTPAAPGDAVFDSESCAWVLSRYAAVQAALREPSLWPVPPLKKTNLKIPDEAAQHALRARVLEAFSAAKLNEWQTKIERVADELPARFPVELVTEFIQPWCAAAAGVVTGARVGEYPRLLAAARIVSSAAAEPLDEGLRARATQADAELAEYFSNAALPMAGPVFVALSRTVACLLANGWLAMLRHPAELERLRDRAELLPKTVEEILRYASIPQSVFRRAARPISVDGVDIDAGDRVILRLASANRDPAQFSDPDRFDCMRRGPAHLSLGFGPHACVGGALIRMVVGAATNVFVERFSAAEICRAVEWEGGSGFRSPAAFYLS